MAWLSSPLCRAQSGHAGSGCTQITVPHAVSQFDVVTYCKDENSNLTLAKYSPGATRTVSCTSYDMTESIVTIGTPSTNSVGFKFAPDRSLFKQLDGAMTTPPQDAGCPTYAWSFGIAVAGGFASAYVASGSLPSGHGVRSLQACSGESARRLRNFKTMREPARLAAVTAAVNMRRRLQYSECCMKQE